MSNHHTTAERRHIFYGQDGPPDAFADGDFALRLLPPAARFSLRIDAATASATRHPAGFDLARSINTLSLTQTQRGDARLSARLGPDEWLLIADRGEAEALFQTLVHDLGDHVYTLVDISHRNLALEVTGDAAAEVLNSGCPLDLGDRSFPAGAATRTLFAKSEIVLMRNASPDRPPLYRVECWRSFGRYVHTHLRDAATLIGVSG